MIILCLLLFSALQGDENPAAPLAAKSPAAKTPPAAAGGANLLDSSSVQLRAAAFFTFNERFSEPYGFVVPNYQIEFAQRFRDNVEAWININWTPKQGSHRDCGYSTINLGNFDLGVSGYYRPTSRLYFYTGVGLITGWVWVSDHLSCCTSCSPSSVTYHDSAFIGGGLIRSGVQLNATRNFFFDFSLEYSYQIACFHRTSVISGLKAAGGFGGRF